VTHNLPLVRSIAQRVAVMSEGRIIEQGDVTQILAHPRESYTRELISNTPSLETATAVQPVVGGGDRGAVVNRG
jgi:peptide/nickel transport system ATP-binding protein